MTIDYRRMIQRVAASKFRDLGNNRLCGVDLVLSRVPYDMRDAVYEYLSKNQRVPSQIENDIYPTTGAPDVVVKHSHGMILSDGSPWGGDNTFTITANIGSHAQLRMDERCIDTEDLANILKEIATSLETMWKSGDFESYKKLFLQLCKGMTDRDAYKSKVGGGIKLVLGPIAARYHEDTITTRRGAKIVPVPTTDVFAMKVVSVFGGSKERLTPEMEKRMECESFLKEQGYTLIPKSGVRRSASYSEPIGINVNFNVDHGSMRMKDGTRWGGPRLSGIRFLGYSEIEYSDEMKKILASALARYVKTKIEAPWNSGNYSEFNKNFAEMLEGIEMRTPEKYLIKMGKRWDESLTTVDNGGDTVVVPVGIINNTTYHMPLGYNLEMVYDSSSGLSREEDLIQEKIKGCVEALKDYYTILPPKG